MRGFLRYLAGGVVIALLAISAPRVVGKEPALDDALKAPAGDLVQSYMFTRMVLSGPIAMAEMGATVYLGNDKITKRNVAKARERYEGRLGIYEQAIRTRGSAMVAGDYRGTSSESCKRSGSSWLGLIGSDEVEGMAISQEGAEIVLALSALHDGEPFTFDVGGYIVESSISLMDPMNSDYYIRGTVVDGRIELRPDARVLQTWPGWASPPDREDIESCVVELTPL